MQSVQAGELSHREEFANLTESGARWFGGQVESDIAVLTAAGRALDRGENPAEICSRLSNVFASRIVQRPFALFQAGSDALCTNARVALPRPPTLLDDAPALALQGDNLLLTVPLGSNVAAVRYPRGTLQRMNDWLLQLPGVRALSLDLGAQTLSIRNSGAPRRTLDETFTAPLSLGSAQMRLQTEHDRFGTAQLLLTVLPILMWGAAAIIGFLVVDRLLVNPLRNLRNSVGGHRIGTPLATPQLQTPAAEIRDLASAFDQFAAAQVTHEAELSRALERQTRLTREVHHRVKNNLQVIASLISLHSRATDAPDAIYAYTSIQRRVDALAIVHRNHYAQLDEGGTLELKPMLSELVSNLRASAGPNGGTITLVAAPMRTSLDTATTLAFLVTELAELAINVDAAERVVITVEAEEPGQAALRLASASLRADAPGFETMSDRYQRVLTGLSRQLRQPLEHDGEAGTYRTTFPIEAQKKFEENGKGQEPTSG